MNNPNDDEMTMNEIRDLLAAEMPADRVEDAIEGLIHKGMVEPLWDENGNISYRLTAIGSMVGKTIVAQYLYNTEQHDGWLGDDRQDEEI